MRSPIAGSLILFLLMGSLAAGQDPAGPPPPAGGGGDAGLVVHELLPDIGTIGAEVEVFGGVSENPFGVGSGYEVGGAIDLPLSRAPRGKLSYRIAVSFSEARSDPFFVTSSVAVVANLALGASLEAALAGPPAAPFPVRREVTSLQRLLQVSPFALRYTLMSDSARLRPYLVAGLDFTVTITQEEPLRDESLVFTGTAPFDDPLLGGLIAQAPELAARGTPTGQGNIDLGGHAGAGIEVRISRGLSLNVAYRFSAIGGTSHHLQSGTVGLGFHW